MIDKLIEYNFESYEYGLISSARYYKKPIIIFNSASLCGYTKQFADFQKIYEDGKIIPMALPTNEFGSQEPGDTHLLFTRYGKPNWNFNKYLFDNEHNFVARFDSEVQPMELLKHV
jgi:glutathione peroxidase-family protein